MDYGPVRYNPTLLCGHMTLSIDRTLDEWCHKAKNSGKTRCQLIVYLAGERQRVHEASSQNSHAQPNHYHSNWRGCFKQRELCSRHTLFQAHKDRLFLQL